MDIQKHLFMNMCFVVFENDIASSCVYCLPSLLETDNCCGHINWCFFRPCFLLRCFLLAPSIHHRRPTLCLKERYFFPFSKRNKIVRKLINLFRKNLIISKVKWIICQCLLGKNGRCKIDNSFDFTRFSQVLVIVLPARLCSRQSAVCKRQSY